MGARLQQLLDGALMALPSVLLTLLVAVVALRLLHAVANRWTRDSDTFNRRSVRTETLRGVLVSSFSVVIYVLTGTAILGQLGVNVTTLLAGVSVIGLAVSFGAQSLVKDVITGFFILLEGQYGVGDVIRINGAAGLSGDVESLNLRATMLRDLEGTAHIIPNSEIKTVSVLSRDFARVVGDVEVPHDYPLESALLLANRVAEELHTDPEWHDRFLEPPQMLGVQTLSPSSVTLRVLMKVRPKEQWGVNREFKRRIKTAFETEGLRTPMPQMSLALPAQARVQVGEGTTPPANAPVEESR
jgi:moderate conductance mechanosensitive channel